MSLREEFVLLAQQPDANRRALCRRFGISPQTAYKWLARHAQDGRAGLADRSRRPQASPRLTPPELEARLVRLRLAHPCWGGRKLSRRLQDLGYPALAPSTVTGILHRHGLIAPAATQAAAPWQRFEHPEPNALWQMDFKGHFATAQGLCHPLTVLDDHSRYNLGLQACAREDSDTVQQALAGLFARYGLPVRINADNGAPWGAPRQPGQLTTLAVWLIRLGVRLSHSRPYHPQTNGKDERFHRSLKAEVLAGRCFDNLPQAQRAFDRWRRIYNHQRPHESLQMATPVSRYRISPRPYPSCLPAIEYGPDDTVLTVSRWGGQLNIQGQRYTVSKALNGLPVALRPNHQAEGLYDLFFVHHRLMQIDLRRPAANP